MTGAVGSSVTLFYGPERGRCRAVLEGTGIPTVSTDPESLSVQTTGDDVECIVAVHDPPLFDAVPLLERAHAVAPSVPVVVTDDDPGLVTDMIGRWHTGPDAPVDEDVGRARTTRSTATAGTGTGSVDPERFVREQAERLDALLDSAPLVVFAIDVDGDVTYAEGRGLTRLGVESGTDVAESVFDRYAEEPSTAAAVEQALEGERIRARVSVDGTTFETWYVPSFDPEGVPDGVVGVATDVTDSQEAKADLERQNERLEAFASLLSHDLRNPLAAATAGVEELERAGIEGHDLDLIRASHDRMDRLIGDVLTLARDGADADAARPTGFGRLVRRSWRLAVTDAAPLDLHIDDRLLIDADPDRLARLLENLFRNASEHGGGPGHDLVVSVGPLEDGAGFYVEDDGPGIPAEERDAVFDPGTSGPTHGTGLGLAIVRTIAEAHGWSVDLATAAGGGARFEFDGARLYRTG